MSNSQETVGGARPDSNGQDQARAAQSRSVELTPEFQAVIRMLARLARSKFFGKIELSFSSGDIVHVRQEKNIKPSDLPGAKTAPEFGAT